MSGVTRTARYVAAIALLGLALAGCQTAREAGQRVYLASPTEHGPGYSIAVPSSLVRQAAPTSEWIPDGFVGRHIRIGVDYGPAWDAPDCNPPLCRIHYTRIGGRPARWFGVDIFNRGDPFDRRMWFIIEVADNVGLSVDVECAGSEACTGAERIVRTIRFQRRSTD